MAATLLNHSLVPRRLGPVSAQTLCLPVHCPAFREVGWMLTDAQWAVLDPLVKAVRPTAKVASQHLRRAISAISAIMWRHDNGAKWRAVPNELGPWWMAAQCFIRWSRLHVWKRLLTLVQEQGVQLGMTFLGGTSIPAANATRFGERTRRRPGRPKRRQLIARPGAFSSRNADLAGLVAAMAPRPA